jgi:hypothetical protein
MFSYASGLINVKSEFKYCFAKAYGNNGGNNIRKRNR